MLLEMAALQQAPHKLAKVAFREMVEVPEDIGVLKSPVVGGLTAEIVEGGAVLRVFGEFRAELDLRCHRCNTPFSRAFDFNIEDTLEIVDEQPQSIEVEDTVWSKGQLDVDDLVRQHLLLSLPSQILCGCEPQAAPETEHVDPRWQKLSGLRQNTEEDT